MKADSSAFVTPTRLILETPRCKRSSKELIRRRPCLVASRKNRDPYRDRRKAANGGQFVRSAR